MSEHKKTITSIAWNPQDPDILASVSADRTVVVWNIPDQRVIGKLENIKGLPHAVGWCTHEKECLSFICGKGPFFIWNYLRTSALSTHKDAQHFVSNVCQFRWHPKNTGKVVFGHANGSISVICQGKKNHKHVLRPEHLENPEDEDPVVDLAWDNLSTDYLLMANTYYGIRLIDTSEVATIMKFNLPSVAATVHTLAWVPNASGIFVTGDTNAGILRIWNVSKSTPIENIKLKKTGFHALHVFTTNIHKPSIIQLNTMHSSSGQPSPTEKGNSKTSLPPSQAVCTFMDGGVGLYDLCKRKWNFLRDEGHVETIFDCKFKSDDPNMLATASFDGTIKIWDTSTMTSVCTSPGNEGVIYNISWAPCDLNCLVAATSRQGAFIWDLGKQKVTKRFLEHGKASVFCVAWSSKDSRRIASCGGDCNCIIRQVDGKLLQKYRHPAPVFGCDWSNDNKDMLATGCDDMNVRVYYLATNTDKPLKVFTGHTAKVFHVKWSPLKEGILCSGSDDGTIRIWDYTQGSCRNVLVGHTAPVRGLLWNTEIPYLLISGSWDYSIRIWDARDGACIDIVLDHSADVYGLASHPSRPFVLATSSRDSTVRLWTMSALIQPLELCIIARRPWSDVIGTPEHSLSDGTPPLLTGRESKHLKLSNDEKGCSYGNILTTFSKFFSHPIGTENLWNLISVISGVEDSMLPQVYSKGIVHVKHLSKYQSSEAQSLMLTRTSKYGAGLASKTREDGMNEAANIHIKLGNIQQYCELLIELRQWEKAISVAPGVSMEYWKSLARRYADYLLENESDDVIPYYVSIGDPEKLMKYFMDRGQLMDALTVAQVAAEGSLELPHLNGKCNLSKLNGYCGSNTSDFPSKLAMCSDELAEVHFRNGSAVLAACCHLAIDDYTQAMAKLIRGNELELAATMGTVLGKVPELTRIALEYLALRCEKVGRGDLAVDLLKNSTQVHDDLLGVCARCAGSMTEIDHIHAKAGFPSLEECLVNAEKLKNKTDVFECVKYYILSTEPEKGLEIGLRFIKDKLAQKNWVLHDIYPMLQLISCIRADSLQIHTYAKSRTDLLIFNAYFGALLAIRRQYDSIVVPLYNHARYLMSRESYDVPITDKQITLESESWEAHQNVSISPTADQAALFRETMMRSGTETWPVGVGPDIVSGSHLPSHSDIHQSFLTNERIRGHVFFLEDGKSAISINNALMWAKVNPFSPLGSGERLNPF